MVKTLLTIQLLISSLVSFAQYPATRQNGALVREERYVTNSPGNGISNSKLIEVTKDSTYREFIQPTIKFTAFGSSRNDGTPTTVLWTDANGNVLKSPMPSIPSYTAGTAIGIASNVITNTAPDQTVVLTGANNLGVSGTYPNFTLTQYVPTVNSNVTRPINGTTFTVSATKPARVNYSITIQCTATIGSAAAADVVFQYSTNGGSSWITTPGKVENSNTVTLAVVLQSVNKQTSSIVADIPAGALCRMVSTTSGVNAVITYNTGQETY